MPTYYVSADGSDSNDGLSEAEPKLTPAGVAAVASTNDTVYFRRGDTFRLTANWTVPAGATVGSYGDGALPIILGSAKASTLSWTSEGGGVYSTTGADGWFTNAAQVGAWELDSYGYAHWPLQADLNSNPGIFWVDGTPDTLYFRTQDDSEPADQEIARWSCLTISNDDVTVQDLRLMHGKSHFVSSADNYTLQRSAVDWQSYYGYEGESPTNSLVAYCSFSYNGRPRGGAALTFTSNSNACTVEYSRATQNGSNSLLSGETETYSWGGGFAFETNASNCIGRYNTVQGMGQDVIASDLLLTVEGAGTSTNTHHHSIAYDGVVLMNCSGGSGHRFHNNTVWGVTRTTDTGNNAPCCLQTVGAHDSVEIKNNIFSMGPYDLSGSVNSLCRISSTSTNNDFDYNQWYDEDASPTWRWNDTNYSTFATYKSASSLDANSQEGDPDLNNPTSGSFQPKAGSPVLAQGVQLMDGGSYNTVLDKSVTNAGSQVFRFAAATTHVSAYFDTSGAIDVDRAQIMAHRTGTPAGGTPGWWVEMWSDSADDPNAQLGSDSDTKDPTVLTTDGNGEIVAFDFPSTISLSASTRYHLVFQGDFTIDINNCVRIKTDDQATDNETDRGILESSDFSTWNDQPNREIWMRLQEAIASAPRYSIDYAGATVQNPPSIGAFETAVASDLVGIVYDALDRIKKDASLVKNAFRIVVKQSS